MWAWVQACIVIHCPVGFVHASITVVAHNRQWEFVVASYLRYFVDVLCTRIGIGIGCRNLLIIMVVTHPFVMAPSPTDEVCSCESCLVQEVR